MIADLFDLGRHHVVGHDLGDSSTVLSHVIHHEDAQRGRTLAPGPWLRWMITHANTGVTASTPF